MNTTIRSWMIGVFLLAAGCGTEDGGPGGGAGGDTAGGGGAAGSQDESGGSPGGNGGDFIDDGSGDAPAASGGAPAANGGSGGSPPQNGGGKGGSSAPGTGGAGDGSTASDLPADELWQDFSKAAAAQYALPAECAKSSPPSLATGSTQAALPWIYQAYNCKQPDTANYGRIEGGEARLFTFQGEFGGARAKGTCLVRRIPDIAGTNWEVDIRFRQEAWDSGHHGGNHSIVIMEDARSFYPRRFFISQGGGGAQDLYANYIFTKPPTDPLAIGDLIWGCTTGESGLADCGGKQPGFRVTTPAELAVRVKRKSNSIAFFGSNDGGKTFPQRIYQVTTSDHGTPFDLRWVGLCDGNQGGYTAYSWVKLRKL